MTNLPPQIPIPYATPAPKFYRPKLRPGFVTAVAIIAIILGGLGLLGVFRGLLRALGGISMTPIEQAYEQNGLMYAWSLFTKISGFVLCLILLIGGIQSMSLKPRGRKLLLFYALYHIAVTIPAFLFNILYIRPMVQKWQMAQKIPFPFNPMAMQMILFFTMVISLGINFFILYVMTRPHVKDAFAKRGCGLA